MTNEIEKFNFDGLSEVRVVMIDGEPWFVLADVAKVLGYRDAANAGRVLAGQGKGTHRVSTPGGSQNLSTVNEAGLYRLIMRSNVEGAQRFQAWVTDEVLPTIRKTGGAYIAPGGQAAAEMLDDPLSVIERTLSIAKELRAERDRLAEVSAKQAEEIEANAPRVWFANAVKASPESFSFEQTAKILNDKHGIDTGRNRLINELCNRGVLMKGGGGYRPYQRYTRYFEVELQTYQGKSGPHSTYTTRVKASALPWLVRELSPAMVS